jgi:hypothetical protein
MHSTVTSASGKALTTLADHSHGGEHRLPVAGNTPVYALSLGLLDRGQDARFVVCKTL